MYNCEIKLFLKESVGVQQIKIDMDLQVIGRIRIVAIFLNTSMMDSNK